MTYQQTTLAQARTLLQQRYERSPFWSNTEADAAFNEALRWWNLFTGIWKRRELIATIAATASNFPTGYIYALTSTLTFSVRVQFNQTPMEDGSIHDLNQGKQNWRGETTATTGAPTKPLIWAPVGLQRIAIWPGDAVGGNTIVVDGVRATPVLTADADFVDIGQAELGAILGEALHLLAFKVGGAIFAGTIRLHREFLLACATQNARLRASTFFRRALGEDRQRWQKAMMQPSQAPVLQEAALAAQGQQGQGQQ